MGSVPLPATPRSAWAISPEFWLNLQTLYTLRLAEQQAGKSIRALPALKSRKGRDERERG